MIFSKKAEIDEVFLTIGVIIGIIIIILWYLLFFSKQTVRAQDTVFETLSSFSSYYELVLNGEEAKILGVEIIAIEDSILTVDDNQICVEAKSIMKTCNIIISDGANYKAEYILEDKNYFNFIKNEDGTVIIEKQ